MNTKSIKKVFLSAKLNGKLFNIESDTLKDAFLSLKEDITNLKTKIFLRVESEDGVCTKVIPTIKGKRMFKDEKYIDIFIRHLIFKSHV